MKGETMEDNERGIPAHADPVTGEARGSGSGAAGGNPGEDYDSDAHGGSGTLPTAGSDKAGGGHPLPASDEARHGQIPERAEREKGEGDDAGDPASPDPLVAPDGRPYPYDPDLPTAIN